MDDFEAEHAKHRETDRLLAEARERFLAKPFTLAAAMLAIVPFAGCAASPSPGPVPTACSTNPYAGTQTAQRQLGAAQQANSALNQARYGLGGTAGIGGLIGAAQGLLGAAQQVQMAQQPVTTYCPPSPK